MKQLLRILLAAIGILAIVAVAAVVYVTTFLDPEDFKPRLTAVVEEQTGLNLALEGPITWSFYPRIGVSVEQARAWLPDQAQDETAFAAINRAEVSVAFAPLLRGEIAVDGLTLDGMRLNLEKNAEGEGNWQPLLERLSEHNNESAETVLAPASAGPNADAGSLSVVLSIASVEVKNADIRYRDEQNQALWRVQPLNISGTNVNPVRSFPLKAMFTLTKHDRLDAEELERAPNMTSEVNLETRLRLGLEDEQIIFENTQLTTHTRQGEASEPQQLSLKAAEIVARLAEQQLSVTEGVLEAGLRHPENWQGSLAVALAFGLETDFAAQTAQLKEVQLTGPDGLRVSGHLNVEQLLDAPQYSGQLTAAPFTLRPWISRTGVKLNTASEAALSDVALTSPIEGSLKRISLPRLSLVVDDSTFTGDIAAALDGTQLSFNLEGDTLNLDHYLPGPETAQQASRGLLRKAFAQTSGTLLPQAWLSTLTLQGDLSVDQLLLAGLTFDDTQLALRGENGNHRLTAFESRFYEGELSATGQLDATGDVLEWQLSPSISNVQVAPLIETFSEEEAPLRGRFNLDGALTTQGNRRDVLTSNLNGELTARLNDGAILRTNISREMCELVAQLEGQQVEREWHPDTRFERFDATFQVRNGIVESDDLLITLPGIDVQGEGDFNLNSLNFTTQVNARLVDTADAACQVNPRLQQLSLPVRCEGHVGDDKTQWCRFDRTAFEASVVDLLRNEAGSRVEKELEERIGESIDRIDERLGEGAGQELRDGIRRLFN
ncbi:AsmA family protein [Vreelandella aquamarina]|jgi:AsmA protein|uniref:AsmA family protein n=1 Tax=Halomonadaceae TaxID=28256 RepID=UPI001D17B0CE|nr:MULTISPECIES: AsmA family protein [Halomonas]MCC4289915.1 AsmA family protein [Halomonas axialensis]MCD1652136.1 AsmA family protein [Halomonas axialensis]MCD2088258.1 AsmA family protein [Halomonas meridiana]MCF2913673.1 AsmA family protein [Halomonas sp. Cn5-12]